MDAARKLRIDKQYKALSSDEGVLHNSILHQYILATWKEHSPELWAELEEAGSGTAEKLAFILQEEMWRRQEQLMRGGLPYTDSCEQAEREILMLEPEAEMPEDRVEVWTPPLPIDALLR